MGNNLKNKVKENKVRIQNDPKMINMNNFYSLYKMAERLGRLVRNFERLPKFINHLEQFIDRIEKEPSQEVGKSRQLLMQIREQLNKFNPEATAPIFNSIQSANNFLNKHRAFSLKIGEIIAISHCIQKSTQKKNKEDGSYNKIIYSKDKKELLAYSAMAQKYIIKEILQTGTKVPRVLKDQQNKKIMKLFQIVEHLNNTLKAIQGIQKDIKSSRSGSTVKRRATVLSIQTGSKKLKKVKDKLIKLHQSLITQPYKFPDCQTTQEDWTKITFRLRQEGLDIPNTLPKKFVKDHLMSKTPPWQQEKKVDVPPKEWTINQMAIDDLIIFEDLFDEVNEQELKTKQIVASPVLQKEVEQNKKVEEFPQYQKEPQEQADADVNLDKKDNDDNLDKKDNDANIDEQKEEQIFMSKILQNNQQLDQNVQQINGNAKENNSEEDSYDQLEDQDMIIEDEQTARGEIKQQKKINVIFGVKKGYE